MKTKLGLVLTVLALTLGCSPTTVQVQVPRAGNYTVEVNQVVLPAKSVRIVGDWVILDDRVMAPREKVGLITAKP